MVMIVTSCACRIGTRQLFTTSPSNKTAHAPHSPSPHPSFVPVRRRSSRRTSSNRRKGWEVIDCGRPLTVKRTVALALSDTSTLHSLHEYFRSRRNSTDRHSNRVLNRVYDRGCGTVNWQLADTLRAARAVLVWNLFKVNANRR